MSKNIDKKDNTNKNANANLMLDEFKTKTESALDSIR